MHIEEVQQGATAHRTIFVLSENGGPLTNEPTGCVARIQTDPADNTTVIERTLTKVTKSRWSYIWIQATDFDVLPTNVEMPAQVIATFEDGSKLYFPKGDPLGTTDNPDLSDHQLKIIILPSLAEPL